MVKNTITRTYILVILIAVTPLTINAGLEFLTDFFDTTPTQKQITPPTYNEMLFALENDDLKTLKHARFNLNAQNKDGETLLHQSIRKNKKKATKILLQRGSNTNIQNKKGETALHIATLKDDTAVILLTLKNGADITIKTHAHKTPKHLALQFSQKSALLLIQIEKALQQYNQDKLETWIKTINNKQVTDAILSQKLINAALQAHVKNVQFYKNKKTVKKIPPFLYWKSRPKILEILKPAQKQNIFWNNCFKTSVKYNVTENIPYILNKFNLSEEEFNKALKQAQKYNQKKIGQKLLEWKLQNKTLQHARLTSKKTTGTIPPEISRKVLSYN